MPDPAKPNWKLRRLMLFSLFYFSLAVVSYVVVQDQDSTTHRQALMWAWICAFLTCASYLGWATWEDVSLAKILGAAK